MIRLNATKQEIENEQTLYKLVKNALNQHKDLYNKHIKDDFDRYNDENQSPHYTNKVKYIDDMSNQLFIGIPPQLSYKKQQKKDTTIRDINDMLKRKGFDKQLFYVGKNASICGNGYLLVVSRQGEDEPRFVSLDARYTNVVYDCDVNPESLFAFTFVEQKEMTGEHSENIYYIVYVYTDKYMYFLRTTTTSDLTIHPLNCVSIIDNGKEFITNKVVNIFDRIPLTQFKNNDEERGDSQPVYKLIDTYNHIREDAVKNIDDVIDYILFLKNVRIGNDEEYKLFKKMLDDHIIAADDIDGKGVDAKFLTNPLNQTEINSMLESISNDIHTISRVPNFASETFAQNASSVALQLKLLGFLNLANEKERCFDVSLMRVLKIVNSFYRYVNNSTKDKIDLNNVEIKYTHNLPSNDTETITQLVNLANINLLDPNEALKQVSWVKDNELFIENAKKWNEEKAKTTEKPTDTPKQNVDNVENIDNNNSEVSPQEKKQMDNLQNFNRGLANK